MRQIIIIKGLLILTGFLIIGAFSYYHYLYKTCWHCDAASYLSRGKYLVALDKKQHFETGMDFIQDSFEQGNFEAALYLAEAFYGDLPAEYTVPSEKSRKVIAERLGADRKRSRLYFMEAFKRYDEEQIQDAAQEVNFAALFDAEGIDGNDLQKVKMWLGRAAHSGSSDAAYRLAMFAEKKEDYNDAIKWLNLAGEDCGDLRIAMMAGGYYLNGKGTLPDYRKALDWYRVATNIARREAKLDPEGSTDKVDAAEIRAEITLFRLRRQHGKDPVDITYKLTGSPQHITVYIAGSPVLPVGTVVKGAGKIVADVSLPPVNEETPLHMEVAAMDEGIAWLLDQYGRLTFGEGVPLRAKLIK